MATSNSPSDNSDNFINLGFIDRQLEALLFVSNTPIEVSEAAGYLGISHSAVRQSFERLKSHYDKGHGLTLIQAAGGWQMCTSADMSDIVAAFRDLSSSQKVRLSRAALETLAAIAYNQPVTRGEMEELRGVRCDAVLETLMRHGLVRIAGRKKSIGSPMLYRTTDRFMEIFGLPGLSSLPSAEELQEQYVGE